MQFSVECRNARLDAIETVLGASPVLKLFTGAAPANCAAADSGTVLASPTLPADAMAAAASGAKAKSGTWEDTSADANGVAGHFRIYKSDGVTCVIQGTVSGTGGGGDMELDNTTLAAGQTFTVNTFSVTDGNA
ncbi:MAG: hypothetical protein KDA17_05900 [Candidatus Saccharibacteria bacterium]|nr:hypothetical protein [Candidatus Saccharibacteria bacterium]